MLHSYTYDDEGRIISVDNGGTGTYVYDADGRRVHRVGGEGPEDYVYDLAGHTVGTFSTTNGSYIRGEIYAGGLHVGIYTGGTTYFHSSDWLGTERVRSDVNGASVETCTNLPYGDEQSCGPIDASPAHFTGKERDTESGNDYFEARYYASSMGRLCRPTGQRKLSPYRTQSWTILKV